VALTPERSNRKFGAVVSAKSRLKKAADAVLTTREASLVVVEPVPAMAGLAGRISFIFFHDIIRIA
jgi:hypothetical protein